MFLRRSDITFLQKSNEFCFKFQLIDSVAHKVRIE